MDSSVEHLRNSLGWRKLEAECYCALVRYGEMKASHVADHIDARTEKVYQPLKKLESMDYVVITDSGPKRYKAQNPTFVIRQEREQFQSDTGAVLEDLQEGWERTQEGNQSTDDHAWVASGTDGMKIETEKLISQARESIAGFDTPT